MSRSEISLLLPSLPTASQAMMADIVNGIVETKDLDALAVCSNWARWALYVAAAVWHLHWLALRW